MNSRADDRADPPQGSEAVLDDEEAAFSAQLIGASEPALRAIRSLGFPPNEVADVLQDASIRAWRHRDQRHGAFRPWFVAIAYREARRPRRRWLTIPIFWSDARTEQDADERLGDVIAQLRKLPKRQQLVLSLRCEAGFSTMEVAEVMSISEPAAKQLLARARQSLRKALDAAIVEVAP
jgi:RNA polymerase sigma factor (sigma-70 family)